MATEQEFSCTACEDYATCGESDVLTIPGNCVNHAFKAAPPLCNQQGVVQELRWECGRCGQVLRMLEQPRALKGLIYYGEG